MNTAFALDSEVRRAAFLSFHLLRGEDADDGSHIYASHTMWESKQAFVDWTESEAFRKAHAQGGSTAGIVLGPPQIRTFESVDL